MRPTRPHLSDTPGAAQIEAEPVLVVLPAGAGAPSWWSVVAVQAVLLDHPHQLIPLFAAWVVVVVVAGGFQASCDAVVAVLVGGRHQKRALGCWCSGSCALSRSSRAPASPSRLVGALFMRRQ